MPLSLDDLAHAKDAVQEQVVTENRADWVDANMFVVGTLPEDGLVIKLLLPQYKDDIWYAWENGHRTSLGHLHWELQGGPLTQAVLDRMFPWPPKVADPLKEIAAMQEEFALHDHP